MRPVVVALLLLATSFAVLPARTAAQSPARPPAPTLSPADSLVAELDGRYGRVALSSHAHGTMVGAALRIPAGSAQDAVGEEGTAHLLARTLEARADDALAGGASVVRIEVDRSSLTVTLLTPPVGWRRTLDRLDAILFTEPLPAEVVERMRRQALARARFRAADPISVYESEAASVLVPGGNRWSSPVRGTLLTLETLTPETVTAYRERWLDRSAVALALAGPLGLPDAEAGPRESPEPSVAAGGTPSPERVAWRVGDRTALVREVTSGWLSVAYPAPSTVPRTVLELLAHFLQEELDPIPPDPARYSVGVEVVDPPGGPVLLVQASLLPEAMGRWETRITDALQALADTPMPDDFFRWKRRRFRTQRLLAEAAPEAEAARMAADLALLGRVRDLAAELWSPSPQAVVDAARALGEPRVLVYGPDLTQDADGAADPAR